MQKSVVTGIRRFSTSSSKEQISLTSQRAEWAKKHIAAGVGRMTELELESGKGSWVTTTDGKKLLDFACGIAVTNTGHSHPKIVKAAQDQVAKLVHGQQNITFHKPMLDLVERLLPIMPKGLDRFFFWNSGSEAVEAAIKLARHATKKQNIIVFQGGFHGRTFGTMSLTTSKYIYRAGFGPLLSGIFVVPHPYCHQCPVSKCNSQFNVNNCCNNPIEQIETLLKQQSSPSETAAILIEPILGEGGYVVPPKGFLKELKELCKKHNILLIADEVQTGFGRTGKYFAVEHFDVTPDILVFAKGIASGFPLSGIASTYDLMATQPPGSMGGTYGGNAVSCAVASATIDVINNEKLLQNTVERGKQLKDHLYRMQKQNNAIGDIRGLGLMVGLEFDANKVKKGSADLIAKECARNGMLLLNTSIYDTVRFIPPLNVTKEEIDIGMEIFEKSMNTVLSQK